MTEKLLYWVSVVLSFATIVLVIINIFMMKDNSILQDEVAHRQATINSGTNLSQLNQGLINALAELAVKNDDRDIRTLLTTQGIAIKPQAQPSTDNSPAPTSHK